jgi:hypothetical protein
MLDLKLIVEDSPIKIGTNFDLAELVERVKKARQMRRSTYSVGAYLPKIRKLGWIGKSGISVRRGDEIWRIRDCHVRLVNDLDLASTFVQEPSGFRTWVDLYLHNNELWKVNIYASSNKLFVDLPAWQVIDGLEMDFITSATSVFGYKPLGLLPVDGDGPFSHWEDVDTVVKSGIFNRRTLVIMWEKLLPE